MKTAELTKQELKKRGIELTYSSSCTDYGCSDYFVFYKDNEKYKIRISDHSVENTNRMNDEIMYKEGYDFNKIANTIELIMFPENYKFIKCNFKEGATHRINGIFGRYQKII